MGIPYEYTFMIVHSYTTVRGKILEGEKFGESVSSLLKTLAFINIGGENFSELPTVHQIRQNFPPPKFSHVRYMHSRHQFLLHKID